jgi:hypothetical protein
MIGAWVYYIGRATSPRLRLLGFFKGLVWPALLVYEILKFLNEELPALQRPAPSQSAPSLAQVPAKESNLAATPRVRSARRPVRGSKPKTKKTVRK